MTLAELLAAVAEETPAVEAATTGDGATEYRLGERVFVVVDADGSASFRLDGTLAAAARRTPDATASDRGPEWVRFAPATLDEHAVDRATAWFGAAARRAGG